MCVQMCVRAYVCVCAFAYVFGWVTTSEHATRLCWYMRVRVYVRECALVCACTYEKTRACMVSEYTSLTNVNILSFSFARFSFLRLPSPSTSPQLCLCIQMAFWAACKQDSYTPSLPTAHSRDKRYTHMRCHLPSCTYVFDSDTWWCAVMGNVYESQIYTGKYGWFCHEYLACYISSIVWICEGLQQQKRAKTVP